MGISGGNSREKGGGVEGAGVEEVGRFCMVVYMSNLTSKYENWGPSWNT